MNKSRNNQKKLITYIMHSIPIPIPSSKKRVKKGEKNL